MRDNELRRPNPKHHIISKSSVIKTGIIKKRCVNVHEVVDMVHSVHLFNLHLESKTTGLSV